MYAKSDDKQKRGRPQIRVLRKTLSFFCLQKFIQVLLWCLLIKTE